MTQPLPALLRAIASGALACPVCFGVTGDNAALVRGLTWGIFLLLAATFGILGSIAVAVVRIERQRATDAARAP